MFHIPENIFAIFNYWKYNDSVTERWRYPAFWRGFWMIWNLNQMNFQKFGIILPDKQKASVQANNHSIPLTPENTCVYQSIAGVWVSNESGQTILSVSEDGEQYQDFYLDKAVKISKGIWFALTAFGNKSTVQMAGYSLPREVETRTADGRFEIRPQLKIDCLYTFLYHEKEQGFVFPGEAHSMMELTYVDQGTVHSVAEGQELVLEQGEMVIYGPGQWHMQYANIGVAPRFVTASFDLSGCDSSKLLNRKFKLPQKTSMLLQQMLREQEQMGEYANDMIIRLLEILVISLLRVTDEPGERLQSAHCINNENEIIRNAQKYISEHVREKLSVPVVARNVDVSTSYLTALFHKHLRISPGEYIRRVKLQESKQMIREGTMNFTEIATVLQYSTIHHFSRQFKEKFGITPSEYAKSVR